MNSKINFWAILVGLHALVAVVAVTPANAASSSPEKTTINDRIARVRSTLSQQNLLTASSNLESEGLISQWQNDSWYDSWYNDDWGNAWYKHSDWDNTNWVNNWYNGGWDNYTWDNWDNTTWDNWDNT